MDNSNVNYTNWAHEQPANPTKRNGCVSVDLYGRWYNENCSNTYGYVCEIPEINTNSTSQSTTISPHSTASQTDTNVPVVESSSETPTYTTSSGTTELSSTTAPVITLSTIPPPTTIPNCQYTSQDFVFSFFLDETTYPDQAGIIFQFLEEMSNIPNPGGAIRDAYVYNTANEFRYISNKLTFDDVAPEYIDQGAQTIGATTVSLEYSITYYQQSGPIPNIGTTIAPTIIMVTSSYITDLDQTKSKINKLRQDRTAYIVSVTLSSDATAQLSTVGFDLSIDLTNGTQTSAKDAVNSIVNMSKFIIEMILFFFFFFLNSVAGTCPEDSVVNVYSKKLKCLEFISPKKCYSTADSFCQESYSGHLTSVEDGYDSLFLAQTAECSFVDNKPVRFWIGVHNISGAGWTNIGGSSPPYFRWAPGEPKDLNGSNGCVSVDLDGLWYNDDCFNDYSYVCEVPEINTNSTSQSTTISPHSTVSQTDT
ncbi:hypothetical protein FO519_009709, partial [Halicephalobus sp. NKZ332]